MKTTGIWRVVRRFYGFQLFRKTASQEIYPILPNSRAVPAASSQESVNVRPPAEIYSITPAVGHHATLPLLNDRRPGSAAISRPLPGQRRSQWQSDKRDQWDGGTMTMTRPGWRLTRDCVPPPVTGRVQPGRTNSGYPGRISGRQIGSSSAEYSQFKNAYE